MDSLKTIFIFPETLLKLEVAYFHRGEHFLETFWMSDELIFLLIKMIVKEKPINPNVFGCNFCLLQQLYMWCFARFGTICTI